MSQAGQIFSQGASQYVGPFHMSWYGLVDAAAVTDGAWVRANFFSHLSVEVTGTFVGTIAIYASNSDQEPAAGGGQSLLSETAPGLFLVTGPARWYRVAVTAYTSGSINAVVHAVSPF